MNGAPHHPDPAEPGEPTRSTDPGDDSTDPTGPGDAVGASEPPLDLATVERDLDGVEAALRRLDDGSYWTDEVTGEPIPDEVLADDPVARRTGSDTARV